MAIRMNKAWHLLNKLPLGSSVEQRISWHIAHQKHCGCRPIPTSLLDKIDKRESQAKK
jgi:hypothetical protein